MPAVNPSASVATPLRRAAVSMLAGLLFATAARSDETTITYSAQLAGLADESGDPLAAGSLVRFGLFDMDASQILANINNLTALEAAFLELSTGMVGVFGDQDFGVDAVFAGDVSLDPELTGIGEGYPSGVVGERLFMWVFNAPDVESATQQGIFSDGEWLMPNGGTFSFDLSEVDPNQVGDFYHGGERMMVSTPELGSNFPVTPLIEIGRIPEPASSTLLFLTAGAVVLLGRRRRWTDPISGAAA